MGYERQNMNDIIIVFSRFVMGRIFRLAIAKKRMVHTELAATSNVAVIS
jgi:hypothetical protein